LRGDIKLVEYLHLGGKKAGGSEAEGFEAEEQKEGCKIEENYNCLSEIDMSNKCPEIIKFPRDKHLVLLHRIKN